MVLSTKTNHGCVVDGPDATDSLSSQEVKNWGIVSLIGVLKSAQDSHGRKRTEHYEAIFLFSFLKISKVM